MQEGNVMFIIYRNLAIRLNYKDVTNIIHNRIPLLLALTHSVRSPHLFSMVEHVKIVPVTYDYPHKSPQANMIIFPKLFCRRHNIDFGYEMLRRHDHIKVSFPSIKAAKHFFHFV